MDGELAAFDEADNMMQCLEINRQPERERNDYSVHDDSNLQVIKQRMKINSIFD